MVVHVIGCFSAAGKNLLIMCCACVWSASATKYLKLTVNSTVDVISFIVSESEEVGQNIMQFMINYIYVLQPSC